MSATALWFMVGAIVALYSLIVDFKWSKHNKILTYKRCARKGEVPELAEEFYKLYYPIEVTLFTIMGPASIFMFYSKCKTLTKESRMQSTHI